MAFYIHDRTKESFHKINSEKVISINLICLLIPFDSFRIYFLFIHHLKWIKMPVDV